MTLAAGPDTSDAARAFTPRAFAWVVAKVMMACVALLTLYLAFVLATEGAGGLAAPTIAPIGYLTFLLGWAVAYASFFRFPERQKILLLGVAIGGVILAATSAVIPPRTAVSGEGLGEARFNLLGFFGGFFGCALQLYFLVIVLRFLPFLRPRI